MDNKNMTNKEIVILPPKMFTHFNIVEIYKYRFFLYSLVERRLKTEFNNKNLAYFWPVFRPVLMVFIFSAFRNYSEAKFGVAIPYTIYAYSGLIFWFFFAESLQEVSSSLRLNSNIIKKVYYPKVLSLFAVILANFIIFLITCLPLIFMIFWFGLTPNWHIIFLPLILFQLFLLIFGIGCIFSSLSLRNNDWGHFLGFALYIGMFISPVLYSPNILPQPSHFLYSLNPMSGLLMGFRFALFSESPLFLSNWLIASVLIIIIFIIGSLFFLYSEKFFADRL